jgi:two-component system sensor histidine kinase ChvG
MPSKPYTVSDTAIARSRRLPPRLSLPGSRLSHLIVGLNLFGLMILVTGALVLNELRQGLIKARIDDLTTQGQLIGNVIDRAATIGEPEPALDPEIAIEILQVLFIGEGQRARLFSADGRLIADSYVVADRVEWKPLPDARPRDGLSLPSVFDDQSAEAKKSQQKRARQALTEELRQALSGQTAKGVRWNESGGRVVSVSIPIRHVRAVLGVLTVEADDVDRIIARERSALIPFILVAVGVSLLSSLLLIRMIAQPIRLLARAADRVRLSASRAITLPKLADRTDEIGDLTRSLQDMTATLADRMGDIERFAADVAHEIKNPLTSLASAIETLEIVSDPAAKARLIQILTQDVRRLDRLVTDISNASRLDAELARDTPSPLDLVNLLIETCGAYRQRKKLPVPVVLTVPKDTRDVLIQGREGPLAQVFRNLIDNAQSFSPSTGQVRLKVELLGAWTYRSTMMGPASPPKAWKRFLSDFILPGQKERSLDRILASVCPLPGKSFRLTVGH